MHRVVVINVVGLTESLIGDDTPHLRALIERSTLRRMTPPLPAVTCTAQASMLTGTPPSEHGVVGNGWYFRDADEIRFWMRSNRLIEAEQVWDAARKRDPAFTCLNMFWRYAAYSSCDWIVIERPIYHADGRKSPDIYAHPADLRDELQDKLGTFPLFRFWGPAASIESTRWIADATVHAWTRHQPTLTLTYLPHLDYCLQKYGPDDPRIRPELRAIDGVTGALIEFFDRNGVRIILLSEYGIEAVNTPIHINRALREAGLLNVRVERGGELLEPGASRAFAVVDHQIAHVYVRNDEDLSPAAVRCRAVPGVAKVLDRASQRAAGIDHPRAGELVLVAERGAWFAYDYWLDDDRAPDFARTVEIHRKPGYDPRDLFLDPAITFPKLAVGWRLLKKKLGFRTLMDVIPLDATLVRGSHGRTDVPESLKPILIADALTADDDPIDCAAVRNVILDSVFGER